MIDGKEIVSQQDERRRQVISALSTNAPRLAAFLNLYQSAFIDGTLSSKVKHLIALATVVAQRSDENISYHVGEALRSGASRDEIREAVTVAVLTAGTPSLLAGMEALASVAEFEGKEMISSKH